MPIFLTSWRKNFIIEENICRERGSVLNKPMISDNRNNMCAKGKKAILVVSYGTSHSDGRLKAINAIEDAIANANDDYEIKRAFSSRLVIDNIRNKTGEEISGVEQAVARLVENGVKTLIIQPTHIMCGNDYEELTSVAERYKEKVENISVGLPLLADEQDFIRLADSLIDAAAEYINAETAIVFIGHGAKHEANSIYARLQNIFTAGGNNSFFVGTIKAAPSLTDVIALVKSGGFRKVILFPLMTAAGNHINQDIAGSKENSWKNVFKAAGFEVECVSTGLGELEAVRNIYVAHTHNAKERFI